MAAESLPSAVLAIDTATPRVSVAVVRGDRVLAAREGAQRESSALLIGWIDETLREAGLRLDELGGAVALLGPGSFTGLRVGLATLLGFHQASGLAVTGLPTLAVLAASAPAGRRVAALVPAGAAEWFVQPFASAWPPRPLDEPRRLQAAELAAALSGGVDLLVVATADEAKRLGELPFAVHVAGTLAGVAGRLASQHPPAWNAALLSSPLYLAPPPVTLPGAPKPVQPATTERRR